MNNKVLIGISSLAAALALSVGTASASTCVFTGNTVMTDPGTGLSPSCNLTVVAKVDCTTRAVQIIAAGATPGDPTCVAVSTGNMPWGALLDAAGAIVGSTINTDAVGSGLDAVYVSPSPGFAAGVATGPLSGVLGAGTTSDTCSPSGLVPAAITINGSWASGTSLNGTLSNVACF